MSGGKVFDTLEQGSLAALNGHGVAMADPRLISEALNNGLLALPFREAVATGDGYYVVWPKNAARGKSIDLLLNWLSVHIPPLPSHDILYLYADKRHKY